MPGDVSLPFKMQMICDYYCRVPIGEEEAELNFAAVLEPLAHILHKEKPANAREEVQLFVDMEEQLSNNTEEIWASIKLDGKPETSSPQQCA